MPLTLTADIEAAYRQFWLPVVASARLAPPSPRPLRVLLLREDLMAFRDGAGRLGLIDALCSHAGALMTWGDVETEGVTCPQHGWLFDVRGRCLTLSGATDRARLSAYDMKAYPIAEAGGLLWAWLGVGDPAPPTPPWSGLPEAHVVITQWRGRQPWPEPLAEQVQTAGWTLTAGVPGGVLLSGPDGLRLRLLALPENERSTACTAVLWHPKRPLYDAERAAMASTVQGPAQYLRSLIAVPEAWDAAAFEAVARPTPLHTWV